ncbi:uncharacterized protein LOC115220334 [Octopus sinensis]|uniref:Uncharacterized protein LOC115220334 n=1 Tax=Octopus sinensis TaxID=2607531 RepID=A0A6P7T5W4_9MOLL|nr:uncharacterized protein LOC115220334 [Octopus sinensis]XP_036365759.1 uncharacterized protein LOC115220334 [Octopus sinensis]XP_036365760.1 uncharacterized protein LOC115220334 [Octopus sinensis]XP_036365761.1 uncharacterized protein LOC115220334 [Octopus sinensis]
MELSSASPVPTDSHGLQDVENESKHDYIVDHGTAEINHNKPPDMNSAPLSFADPLKLSTNLEYLMSSTEEDENKSSFTNEKLASDSSLILNEAVDVHTVVSCLPNESLGIILGMNERIEFEEGEKREVYMKKIVPNGAVHRVVLESQSFTLGDEILAINGAYFEKMTRSECIKLLTNLPSEVSFISRRNPMPWTAGPRCSFYLNLIDNNRESILSPAPKLFTNEGKKIPDNYKLLEISLYREIGDQLGISLVPSYGDTNHYYQIKSLDLEGLCSKSKLLNQGDCLVSCNGNSLYKIPFNQCLNIINSEGPSLTFEILRKDAIAVDENIESETNINQKTKVYNNNSNNTWNPEIELENRNIKDKPKEFDENEDLLISFKDLSTEDSEISIDLLNNVTAEVAKLQESTSDSYTEENLTSETVPVESTTQALCLDPIGTPNLSSETQHITEVNLGGSKDKSLTEGIVEDKCVQQDVVSEHSSVPNNSAGQRNMSEYRNSKQEFSLNGSDDSLISNELNNNFSIICPCYSNEDLISLGLDSPPPHKADLTFQSTVVAPREAAGESKSDLDDIDIDPFLDQQDNYRSEHNLNNFNINRTGFPISHHQKIKITNNSNDLLNFQSNNNQKKLASYNELLEDELESPFSTDGSLPSSFGAQAADEDGDINTHLSLMHSQNDGVEETLVMSPDSGRPDSPRIQKNSSLNSLTISHKRDIASPYSNISDDFKSEDDSSTVYYDVKTDEDDTTTYQDLSEISTELGDKFQKSNHSDFSESADSCKTSESSFDMCNDGDQETNRSSKPLKNTMMSGVHLKSRDTKSLPRTMTSSYMTESFQDNQLKSLNKYAIDTSLLKNVSEKILPSSNSSVNNKEKLVLPKRLFSSSMKQERKNSNKTRSEEKPFRVEVLKGILGLGMTLTVDENGFVRVSEIKSQSTIGKNGNIKVGDYILSINSTDLVNVTDSQVQQILRLLPRGLITVIASVLPITDWKSHFADADKFGRENSTNQNGIGLTAPVKISSITSIGSLSKVETKDKTVFDKAKTDIDNSSNSLTKDSNFNFFKQPSIRDKGPSALEINAKPSLDKPVHVEKTLNEDLQQITEIKPNNTRNYADIFGTNNQDAADSMSMSSISSSSSSSSSSSNYKEDNLKPSNVSLTRSEPMKTDSPKIQVEKRALPDILQDHAEPIKKQYISKAQNSVIQNSTNRNQSPMDIQEDVIVPLQSSRIMNYSVPPQASPRKALRYFPKPGDMDLVDPEEKDKSVWVKKSTKNTTIPSGNIAKEDLIIPAKAKSVRSLVERYSSPPQKSKESRRVEIKTSNGVTEKIRAVNMKAAQNSSPKPAAVEELVQAVHKHRFASDFKAPKSVNNNTLSMDDILVIEKTEELNSKPNVKMTLKSNFLPEKGFVAEPVIEPMQKSGNFARPKPAPRQKLLHNKDNDQSKYQMDDLDVLTVDGTSPKTSRSTDKRPGNSITNVSVIQELLIKPTFLESKLMNKKYGAVNSSPNTNTMNEDAIVPVVKKPRYSMNIQKLPKLHPVSMEDDNTEENKTRGNHSTKQKSYGISYLQEIFDEEKIVPQVKKSRDMSQLSITKTPDKNEETTLGIWQCNTKLPNTESGQLNDDVEFKEFSTEIPKNKPVISESILEITQKKPSHSARTSDLDDNKDQNLLEDFDPIEKENVAPIKWNRIDCNLDNDPVFVRSSEDLITLDTAIKPEHTLVSHTAPEELMKSPSAQPLSQKRSLPVIEDGKPKPLPRRSRSPLSESDTSNQEDNFRPKRRTLPTPRGSMTSPNADKLNETLKSTPFEDSSSGLNDHHSVSPPVSPNRTRRVIGSPVRELNPALSPKRGNSENNFFPESSFNTYGSQTMQKNGVDYMKIEGNTLEQTPEMFITGLPQQYTDIKEVRESSGRHLPKIPVVAESPDSSRSLPSIPFPRETNIEQYHPDIIVEEQKSISRSLPIVPEKPALSPFYEEPLEPVFKTAVQTPLIKQTAVSENILQTVKLQDSTFKSVPSSLPNSEISPVIFPSSPKLVSVNSSFSEKQPAIIHATKNDTQNSVASSPKRPTNWNSEASDKQTSSSPLTVTKKSDFAVEEDLCSRVVVTKDKHSIRNGRTSPRSLPLVDLSDFSTDNSKERTSSVLTSNMSHVAVEPIKDNRKKESYHSTEVSFDQFDSPSRSLATQSSNIKQIPDKNETKMEWSTNLPPTLDSTSPLIPTNSSLISISTESHVAPIELVQKEESVGSHSMPPSFSASKSKETETVSSQMVIPAVEQPISPRITSNRKLPDIFKSSRTNAPVVGQITSPSASEILFTDFAPGSPNVSPVIESVIDIQKSKHNFAEVPKAEIATSEPIVMQPKVSKDLLQSPVETTSMTSSQVTISKDDAVSQNKFQTPSTAKAETFPLKADQEIPEVERRRASLKRETLESVTQVESSRKGTQKTNGDDFKDNLPSGEHKKLTVNIPTSPKKSEVIQDTNQSPQSTDSSSVMLRRSRGRSQGSPRSELISEKSLVFSPDSKVSESSSKQMSLQRRKELAKTCIEPHMVFTKRKWCISTRFGQTNFALPSEPESSQDVLKLSLLDEDTVIDFVSKANFALDKLGLSNHYSIHICIVEKEASEKVGIRLQKGEKQELLISLLEPDGAAKRQQYIYEGDLLLYMNDKPAWNQTVMDMKTLLQTTATRIILLLARPFVGEDSETFEITLRKGVTGLGFSLGGGIGCPLGDRPISVKRIFKGGIADKCGEMRVGDEILEVNGEDFRNQRHFHAWNHLKFLPEGDLKLLICRHRNSEKVDPLPTRTRTARPGTASGETASATSTTTTVTTTTSVEPRDPPSVTPVLPLVQLSPEKASTGIAAAAAMIAISTVGAVKDPHQLQKSTTTTTTNTTITTNTTTMQTQ